jgi:hypothetical protein
MAFEQLGDQNVLGGLNNQNIIRGEDQPHPVSKEDLNAFFTALSMLPYAGAIGQMMRGIGTTGRAMSRFEDGGAGPSSPKAPEPAPAPAPKFGPEPAPSPETPPAPPSVPLPETLPAPVPSPVPSPAPSPASSSTWNTRQAVTGGARAFDYMGQPKVVVRGRDGHWTGQDSHGVYYTDRNYYNDGLYGNVADALAKAGGRVPAPAESSWHGLTRAIGEMTPEQFSEFMQRLEALRNARGAMPR